ncbi:unnamed protein product [Taenia asiatica]|uniref:Uncharacterized protein n=1 Tax=Taenia asiatica TaxID=60517 RepID=A0A0R3W526_TAEAS|nr:unnamed protein product [Taenia asiatica]
MVMSHYHIFRPSPKAKKSGCFGGAQYGAASPEKGLVLPEKAGVIDGSDCFYCGSYLPGISLQHRTTPREWYCINDFADALSRTILRDLYVPPPTANFESTARKLLRTNHNRQQLVAPRLTWVGHSALGHSSIASLLEATASRLEQVIMREVFSSALLLLRPKSPPLPLPSHSFPQCILVRFAQDLASQACQSAKWRMRAIQRVADSMLCSLAIVTSSDFHSTMVTVVPMLLDDEESVALVTLLQLRFFTPTV